MTIASSLIKAGRLLEQLKAAQPADPFASFSPEQRQYCEKWWARFKSQHSARPETLYEAVITHRGWTPTEWLNYPRITTDMTMTGVQALYIDQLGKTL